MRLLLLTPHLPYPAHQGASIRNYNLIKQLSQRHAIDLLTFLAPDETLTLENPLHHLCTKIATVAQPQRTIRQRAWETLTTPLPDMALRLDAPAMHAYVEQWTKSTTYDIVQVEGIEMAPYIFTVRGADAYADKNSLPGLVFDNHNCEYLLQKRNAMTDLRQPRRLLAAAYSMIQWQKLRHYEAQTCRHVDAIIAVSEADKRALQVLGSDLSITVASNGVVLEDYDFTTSPLEKDTQVFRLSFTGKMDYRPNIDAALWFGKEVLPRIQAYEPNVRFQIVGSHPHARLDVLRDNPAIEITGSVPDTRPYIRNAHVYIIPMRVGGGTRFKALEAMACQQAIVSTSLGVEGIPVQHQQEMLLADTPEDFARAVLQLIEDARATGELARRLGANGRRFVAETYQWTQITPKLEQVYARVLAQKA